MAEKKSFLDEISQDFKRLQNQKARKHGGVEARVLLSLAFSWGEQYVAQKERGLVVEPQEDGKLYLVFNLIDSRAGKLMGRLSAIGGVYGAVPNRKDPKAMAQKEVVDRLIKSLDEKLDQPSRMWEILFWMLHGGVAFELIPWIPNATIEPMPQFDEGNRLLFKNLVTEEIVPEDIKDQIVAGGVPEEQFDIYEEIESVGEVGSEIFGPLNVFVDQSVKSLNSLAPDQAVYIARIRTRGWIEENFGEQADLEPDKELKIVTTSLLQDGDAVASLFLKDMIPTVQGTCEESDPDMNVVVERYLPVSKKNPRGRYTCFVPNKKVLFDDECPYEEIPIVDYHWKPVTTTFWTKDYVTDLIAPQRFINKRLSQLGEQANASIYDKILLGGALSERDIPADFPGIIKGAIGDNGTPLVQRLAGPALPAWFLESINVVTKMFNDIAGGMDLFSESKFPGQLRGPMAVPMLQEILDTEFGPLYQHLGERLARAKQMRLNRVKQFYPPIRTIHYTGKDARDEVLSFHTEKILKAGTSFTVTVERTSLLPELRALKEQRVMDRLNGPLSILYTDSRTGALDKAKIAAEMEISDYSRVDREAQARKFALQLIERLWRGEQVPVVQPFWDHAPMLDELESQMMTTEFLSASEQVQQIFIDRWNQHNNFLQQAAQAQMMSQQSQMIQGAVAQATQQAAAVAAAQATDAVLGQLREQAIQAPQNIPQMLQTALTNRNEV